MPTKEYFQSSGWVDPSAQVIPQAPVLNPSAPSIPSIPSATTRSGEAQSVRSGSDFWALGHHTESSSEFTAAMLSSPSPDLLMASRQPFSNRHRRRANRAPDSDDSDSSDSDGTQIAARPGATSGNAGANSGQSQEVDEIGAQDAFVAGMMFALSRRLVPGEPYTPSAVAKEGAGVIIRGAEPERERDRGRWRLEECLRWVSRSKKHR